MWRETYLEEHFLHISLIQHIKSVNFQVAVKNSSQIANPEIFTVPGEREWTFVNGCLQVLWISSDFLPPRIGDTGIFNDTLDRLVY